MNKPFKLQIVWAGLMALICIMFGFWLGWDACAAKNNVDGMQEELAAAKSLSETVTVETRDTAVRVEEQIANTEKALNELRGTLMKLKHSAAKAGDTALEKMEEAGKSIEEAKKTIAPTAPSDQ